MSKPPRRPAHMNSTGQRIKFYPLEINGHFNQRRRLFGWFVLLLVVVTPWIKWGGEPLFQLNPELRRLSAFGHFYFPTDINLVVTAIIAGVIGIVAVTARYGRVWCGWACPQTLFLHWIAEPVERFFEGNSRERKRRDEQGSPDLALRRGLRYLTMAVISIFLGHSLLSFFAGSQVVFFEYWQNPAQYPITTFFAILFSGALFFDMVFMKEIFCTVLCPYARLQGVLVDSQSLLVRYQEERGEPRVQRKSAAEAFGDCVNCDLCHKVCPTGIDIRDGYQLECISCARCIDACNTVMERTGKQSNLVGYHRMQKIGLFHWRTVLYAVPITILLSITAFRLWERGDYKMDWNHQRGSSFIERNDSIINSYQLHLLSTIHQDQNIVFPVNPGFRTNLQGQSILLKGGTELTLPVIIIAPKNIFSRGIGKVEINVGTPEQAKHQSLHLVGPW